MFDSAATAQSKTTQIINQSTERQIPISAKEFQEFSAFIYNHAGINLRENKINLLKTRLNKHLLRTKCSSYADFLKHITNKTNSNDLQLMVDAISTNHTFFFREAEHFEFMKNIALPDLKSRIEVTGKKDIRLWCAASSSGEEPYGLAMIMMEFFKANYRFWDAGLLATDISRQILTQATEGIYNPNQVSRMPKDLLAKYFDTLPNGHYQVKEILRKQVTYRCLNLMQQPYPFKREFHLVFCRNVLIYFDDATVERVIHGIHQKMAVGGYLFVGHSESLKRINNPFTKQVENACFQKT